MRARARHTRWAARRAVAMAVGTFAVLFAVQALAAAPEVAEISEPALGGAPLSPDDVHIVAAFHDPDGDTHVCSTWEIWTLAPAEPVWQAPCARGQEKVHIHLGDGEYVNSYAGRTALMHDVEYELRVRFLSDDGSEEGEWSEWATREFSTRPPGSLGNEATAWTARTGYVVETFAEGLQLPVNIAMIPNPGPHPGDPLMYVAELYGTVKVITRDGTVKDYATDLLNFNPTGNFPGSGEMGLTGIVVEPETGDVFVSLVYEDEGSIEDPKPHYPKVIRFESDERGLSAIGQTTVLDMAGEVQGASHQISNLTIGPDGNLYVHNGDGGVPSTARDLESFRGKILRMTLDGDPLPDNPYAEGAVSPRDYVWASGLRNPFGGAWRLSDGSHYEVENGPATDRLARIVPGADYLWEGRDETMAFGASYTWFPPHAPVNIEFVEPDRLGGSGFPAAAMGGAFVTESGPTWASGPQAQGKRIVEFALDGAGNLAGAPDTLVEYTGIGKATAVGLAAGLDGLYFTDLYKDIGFESPIDRGANVLRVRYCGANCPTEPMPEEGEEGKEISGPVPDRSAPSVQRFQMQRAVFTVGGRAARGERRSAAKLGTAFLYSLSERASVRIQISPLGKGDRPRGVLEGPGRVGPNRRPFAGRLGRRWLPPGRYEATIRARDADGNDSKLRSAHFRVVSQ